MTQPLPPAAVSFIFARAASGLGAEIVGFALKVWIFKATGSYALFATISFFAELAGLIFSVLVSPIVDRFPKRSLALASDLVSLSAVVGLLLGELSLAYAAIVICVLAMSRMISWTVTTSSIGVLGTAETRPRLNGISESLSGLVRVSGPLIGAGLLEFVGLASLAMTTSAVYIVSLVLVNYVNDSRLRQRSSSAHQSFISEIGHGVDWVRRDLLVFRLAIFFAIVNFGSAIYVAAYVPYLLSRADTSALSMCFAAVGIGITLAGLLFSRYGARGSLIAWVGSATMALAIAMLLVGLASQTALLVVLAFAFGMGVSISNAAIHTLLQQRVPKDMQARVLSVVRLVAWGLNPVAILISVPAVELVISPLLANGSVFASAWGEGRAGALGVMISSCGAVLFLALIYLWRLISTQSVARAQTQV